jgi:hypothetical protein
MNAAIEKTNAKDLKTMASSLEKDAGSSKSPADAERMRALAQILKQSK